MKSAFREYGALLSIGGAILYTVGLNPQRITGSSEARFPAHAIPGGMHYQKTGLGERTTTIEATTFPHVFGGMDSYAVLRAIHESQATVPLIRLAGNYKGVAHGGVVIQSIDVDEDDLHPFDGVGRRVDVSINLIMMPAGSFQFGRRRRGARIMIGAPRR